MTKRMFFAVISLLLILSLLSSCIGEAQAPESMQAETHAPDALSSSNGIPTTISGTDIASFEIVCSSTLPAATTAASELQKYIMEATGCRLHISPAASGEHSIFIDAGDDENAEGFSVKTSENDLTISGDGPRGALYGVYDFLEKYMGWRFLASDTDYLIPKEKLEIADIDYSEAPGFAFRDPYWSPYFDGAISAKRKINSSLDHGLTVELGGSVGFTGGMCHTIARLYGCSPDESPCLSAPETFDEVMEGVTALLEANPDARLISVSQNDNADYCTCFECQRINEEEGSPSGTVIRLVNKIADAVAEEYPNVMLHTFAYQYSRHAPKVTVPRDNVVVQLCSIKGCFNHALNDPACERNAAFVQDLKDWSKICKHLYIWDYTTDYYDYLAVFPDFDVLAENMRLFYENGVVGVFEEGMDDIGASSGELGELRAYLLSKLLWNPEMTDEEYDTAINEFMRGYYGDGWEYIRKYLDFLTESANTKGHFDLGADAFELVDRSDVYHNLAELDEWFDTAESLAKDEKTLDHIRRTRINLTYLELNVTFDEIYSGDDEAAKAELLDRCQRLYDDLNKYNIHLSASRGCPSMEGITERPSEWY